MHIPSVSLSLFLAAFLVHPKVVTSVDKCATEYTAVFNCVHQKLDEQRHQHLGGIHHHEHHHERFTKCFTDNGCHAPNYTQEIIEHLPQAWHAGAKNFQHALHEIQPEFKQCMMKHVRAARRAETQKCVKHETVASFEMPDKHHDQHHDHHHAHVPGTESEKHAVVTDSDSRHCAARLAKVCDGVNKCHHARDEQFGHHPYGGLLSVFGNGDLVTAQTDAAQAALPADRAEKLRHLRASIAACEAETHYKFPYDKLAAAAKELPAAHGDPPAEVKLLAMSMHHVHQGHSHRNPCEKCGH